MTLSSFRRTPINKGNDEMPWIFISVGYRCNENLHFQLPSSDHILKTSFFVHILMQCTESYFSICVLNPFKISDHFNQFKLIFGLFKFRKINIQNKGALLTLSFFTYYIAPLISHKLTPRALLTTPYSNWPGLLF